MVIRVLAVSAALVASAGEARAMECAAVTESEIESQFARFNDGLVQRDPDKITALFASDAVLLPTASDEPRTTPAGVRDYFVTFVKSAPVSHIDTSAVRLGCNMAARMGTWTFTLTDQDTAAKTELHARYTFIYKYSDGRWWIDHLHSSRMPGRH